jgi:hypothetical protein
MTISKWIIFFASVTTSLSLSVAQAGRIRHRGARRIEGDAH